MAQANRYEAPAMQIETFSVSRIWIAILPWKSAFAACLCLMAIGLTGCGGETECTDICGFDDLGLTVVDHGIVDTAVTDTSAEQMFDTYVNVEVVAGDAVYVDGNVLYDLGGTDAPATLDDGPTAEVQIDDDADVRVIMPDAWDGDWYVYFPGTPFVEVYAEYADFSWSQTVSGVGEPVPTVLVQMAHVPVEDLQDWIDDITAAIRLTSLSGNSAVPATVTAVPLPVCDNGGCRSPGLARWEVQVVPDDAIADAWYRIGMESVSEPVASAVIANKSLRFRPGHDARVGRIRFQAQPGYDNQGAFNIVFTEMMHSPALADFPTLRVAQGASSSLACDFYTDETMWLAPGRPQFNVRSCTGLDITQPFTIYLGGTLLTVDGKKLQPDGGEYRVDVLPANWVAACVDTWSCNEIPVP